MKQCPTCGATYDAAVRFCVRDGAALIVAPVAPTYSPPAPGRARLARLSVPVLVLAGAVVGLLILLAVLLLRQPGETTNVEIASEPVAVEPMPEPMPAAPSDVEAAFANSPGDGFMALRSEPSVARGSQLLQIPHGAAVEVLHCDGPADVADGRSGTWCRVGYAGREGWAFDGFLAWSEPAALPSERETRDPTHLRVVEAYLSRQSTNDIPYILGLYAERVRYYDKGWVDQSAIYDDKAYYFDRWPTRTNRLDSPVRAVVGPDGVTTLRFTFRYTVRDGARHLDGSAWAELNLTPPSSGFLIQGERGGVL